MSDCGSFGGSAGDQLGEVGDQVIAAATLELAWQVGGPVGAEDFERVGEDRVGRLVAKGVEQRGGYIVQVLLDCGSGEVVEDEAFGTDCGALYRLFCVTCDEEECGSRS